MTTQNPPMSIRLNRTAGILSSCLVAAVILAGCSSPAPQAAPTSEATAATATPQSSAVPAPTPTSAAAPTSESEAVVAAEATLAQFVQIMNAVIAEKGVSPERINAVAVPPANTSVITSAQAIADQGYVVTGGITSTVEDSYSGGLEADGTTVPFGSVMVTTCYDSSTRTVTLPSGEAAPQPPNPRGLSTITVVYSPAAGAWFVRSLEDTGEAC